MASSSSLRPVPSDQLFDAGDMDLETLRVITELICQDIAEISGSRKGKARADAPLSDEELALQMQQQDLQNAFQYATDHRMAESIHNAVEADQRFLNELRIVEQAAADDRRAAQALEQGLELPPASRAQRLVEDPVFLNPGDQSRPSGVSISGLGAALRAAPRVSSPLARNQVKAPVPVKRVNCIVCDDQIKGPSLKGPCGHVYCADCVSNLVDACTRDDSLYPPRCCNQPFVFESLTPLLSLGLRTAFNVKRLELDVPAANRVYCPNARCSAFLGSSERAFGRLLRCAKCGTSACSHCKQTSHLGECPESENTKLVRELAREQHWQTCPGCKNIIELNTGCYHITCRCRFQFCYLCAEPWKNCRCPQWDERHLISTAEQRVRQEHLGRPQPSGLALSHLVREMANTLQDNHGCVRHSWHKVNIGGQCEECRNHLRDFLLHCRHCRLMACVRCARNRL